MSLWIRGMDIRRGMYIASGLLNLVLCILFNGIVFVGYIGVKT